MGETWNQLDLTPTGCGTGSYCAGNSAATTEVTRQCDQTAGPGSNEFTITLTGNTANKQRAVYFQPTNDLNRTTWKLAAGGADTNWIVPCNVTAAGNKTNLQDLYICKVNSSCGSPTTVASVTDQAIDCGTTGVKNIQAQQGSDVSSSLDDTFIAILLFDNENHGDTNVGITPDQTITSPLEAAADGDDRRQMWTTAGAWIGAMATSLLHTVQMMVRGECSSCNRRKAKALAMKKAVETYLKKVTGRDIPATPV